MDEEVGHATPTCQLRGREPLRRSRCPESKALISRRAWLHAWILQETLFNLAALAGPQNI